MSEEQSEQNIYHYLDIAGKSNLNGQRINQEYLNYRKAWEENPKHHVISDFPLYINAEATGNCNLMCVGCFRFSRKTEGRGYMNFNLFKKIVDEGKEYGLKAINPSWLGESFLHPQIIEMINYAKSQDILDVVIDTNGTLINEEMSKKIIDSGLDRVVFSIDVATESEYNRVKCGSDFKEVNENINYLIDLKNKRGLRKPIVTVQVWDKGQNKDELMAFIYHWKNKADKIRVSNYHYPDSKPNEKDKAKQEGKIFACPQLWQRLVVGWNGIVYPCLGDNACREPLGNLEETRIYDIWHGEKLTSLREKHKELKANELEMCLHCDLNKIPAIANNYGKEMKEGG